eukprot:26550-Eustigmatos_ZCMA.PRE.1
MLSHKKYNQLVSGIAELIHDDQTMQGIMEVVKSVMEYSEDQKRYNPAHFEKVKEKRRAGDTSWNDYQRKYYEAHKQEVLAKRKARYHSKKQELVPAT